MRTVADSISNALRTFAGYEARERIKWKTLLLFGDARARMLNEFIKRKIKLKSLPWEVVIDAGNICDLRCPLCITGEGKLNRPQQMLALDNFKRILDKVDFAREIDLFKWGEPLLNPHLFEMIQCCKMRNKKVYIHSNFLRINNDQLEKIIDSGLDELTISLDGASQETYSKYREGGNFETVFGNMAKLIDIKRKRKAVSPKVIWKFLVNRYNEHEKEKAKGLAEKCGVEILFATFLLDDTNPETEAQFDPAKAEKWLPVQDKSYVNVFDSSKTPVIDDACPHLWQYPVINPDGGISRCCFVIGEIHDVGNLLENENVSFREIWNNDLYQYSRSLFSQDKYSGGVKSSICDKCRVYKKVR